MIGFESQVEKESQRKIVQKSGVNQIKIDPKSFKIGLGRDLGGLGGPGRLLDVFWPDFWSKKSPTWPQVGPPNGAQMG